jgi:hypothetical protein
MGTRTRRKETVKVVHVLRKPCSEGTVAANVLRHGTGALNIDATRIGTDDNLGGGAYSGTPRPGSAMGCEGLVGGKGSFLEGGSTRLTPSAYQQPTGRWPANLVLQHLDGCVQDGVRDVRSNGHYPARRPSGSTVSGPSGHKGQEGLTEAHTDGEAVAAWACEEGCPVAALDAQSGVAKPKAARAGKRGGSAWQGQEGFGSPDKEGYWPEDCGGGASRFFKQIKP